MRRKKLLAGVLTTALLVGSISPAGVMGAEVQGDVQTQQVVMIEETGRQGDEEEAVTAEEEVKSAEADENGFVIENGVLTKYPKSRIISTQNVRALEPPVCQEIIDPAQ